VLVGEGELEGEEDKEGRKKIFNSYERDLRG
jgi:hypothetical protein